MAGTAPRTPCRDAVTPWRHEAMTRYIIRSTGIHRSRQAKPKLRCQVPGRPCRFTMIAMNRVLALILCTAPGRIPDRPSRKSSRTENRQVCGLENENRANLDESSERERCIRKQCTVVLPHGSCPWRRTLQTDRSRRINGGQSSALKTSKTWRGWLDFGASCRNEPEPCTVGFFRTPETTKSAAADFVWRRSAAQARRRRCAQPMRLRPASISA